jgi:recombination associated protein RdgC
MGAFQGSITYSKFHVQGDLPDNVASAFVRRVRNRVFEPLAPEDEVDRRWGWCSIQDPFDLDLDSEKLFFNSYLNVGLRIDRWALPKPLFRANMAQAIRAALEKKDRDRLSRKEKDELKVTVTRRLRKQTLPTMKVIDLSWNMETGVLRFWNRSAKMIELMQDFFEKTFEKKLLPHSPYSIALRAKISDREMKEFEALEPAAFHAEVR